MFAPGCDEQCFLLELHYYCVHNYSVMKNITLSADENLIREAREAARSRKTTLNQLFRDWLVEVSGQRERSHQVDELLERLQYVNSGGPSSRDEMNER